MARSIVCPQLLAEEYDVFVALLNGELPSSYDGWLERATKENSKSSAQGNILNHVVIHPQDFSDYCLACGQDPSLTMLNAFAVVKSRGKL